MKAAVLLEDTAKANIALHAQVTLLQKALGKILKATHQGSMASQCAHCVIANELAMDAVRDGGK